MEMVDKIKQKLKNLFLNNQEAQDLIESSLTAQDFVTEVAVLEQTNFSEIDNLKTQVGKLVNENRAMLTLLSEMKEEREKQSAELKKQAEKELEKKVKETLEAAVKDGRIPSQNDELKKTYEKALKTSFEDGLKIIESLPKKITSDDQLLPVGTGKNYNTANSTDPKTQIFQQAKQEIANKLSINKSINNERT